MQVCETYLYIRKSYRFNFFYLDNQYFTLNIVLILIMIRKKYFTIGNTDAMFVFFDLDTNNGCLSESNCICIIRIDFGLKTEMDINTCILAQCKY